MWLQKAHAMLHPFTIRPEKERPGDPFLAGAGAPETEQDSPGGDTVVLDPCTFRRGWQDQPYLGQ